MIKTKIKISHFLDLVYPRECWGCQHSLAQSSNRFLCFFCWQQLPLRRKPICLKCGYTHGPHCLDSLWCLECLNRPFAFKEVRLVGPYKGLLRRLLICYKFEKKFALHYLLAAILAQKIKRHPFPDKIEGIVAVPLAPKRERERGYNQATYLALSLSQKLQIPYLSSVLEKKCDTVAQSTLSGQKRRENVQGVFHLVSCKKKEIKGKVLLLVDDVITTGSTAHECARILKKTGAKKVYLVVIARTEIR